MAKTALFVFNSDPTCFIHVLLNALDMQQRNETCRIVVEGAATALLPKLAEKGHPLAKLWRQTLDQGLVAGACRACAAQMGGTEAAVAQGLPLLDDMNGHPSMAHFRDNDYTIITF